MVGTPVRQEFLAPSGSNETPSTVGSCSHLLIFGGSQGAKAINSAVLDGLASLTARMPNLMITHQTGEADYRRVQEGYAKLGAKAEITPFLYDMPTVLRSADLVVARAGAMTIAELTACGKPAILIPLPTAIYDHQMKNARAMEAAGGATVLPQADLTGSKLSESISTIMQNTSQLQTMSAKSRAMRRIDAGEAIVRECYALMGVTHDGDRSVGAAGA